MQEEIIQQIIDEEAIQRQLKILDDGFGRIEQNIASLSKVRIDLQGADTWKQFNSEVGKFIEIETKLIRQKAEHAAFERQIQKDKENAIKISQKEAKMASEISNEYKQLNIALRDAEIRYKNLALSGKANTKEAKDALTTALSYRKMLDGVDQALGNYQRNVGNYKSAFNGLNASMQQILRETPSLAINAKTFFLAISNNLPIFFDEIKKVKDEIKATNLALKESANIAKIQATEQALMSGATQQAANAAGVLAEKQALANLQATKAPSLFQLLITNLFSWQSAMTIGITLLTIYGPKLIDWANGLLKGKDAMERTKREAALLNDVNKKMVETAGQEIAKLSTIYSVATNNTISTKERRKAVEDLQKEYPSYFANIDKETIMQGKAASAYDKAKEAIIEKAKAQAIESKLAEEYSKKLDIEIQKADKQNQLRIAQIKANSKKVVSGQKIFTPEDYIEGEGAVKALTKDIAELDKKTIETNENINFLLGNIKIANTTDKGIGTKKSSSHKDISDNTEEEIAQSKYNIQKRSLERQIKINEEIVANESNSYEKRLDALKNFNTISLALIEADKSFKEKIEGLSYKKTIEGLIKAKSEDGANRTAINAQIAKEEEAHSARLLDIGSKANDDILELKDRYGKEMKRILEKQSEDLKAFEDQFEQLEESINKTIKNVYKKIEDADKKKSENEKQLLIKRNNEKIELQRKFYEQSKELLVSFVNDRYEAEKSAIDSQISLLDDEKRRRIEAVNNMVISAQEKADRIAVIEATAQSKKEELEKRKRKIDMEQAKWNKAANAASVIADTAAAIMKAIRTYGIPLATPIIAWTAAIGALQLGKILSTPIPKYKHGRGKGKSEYAIVDDGGIPEPIMREDGSIEFSGASKPRLTYLNKGDIVFPSLKSMHETMLNKISDEKFSYNSNHVSKKLDEVIYAINSNTPVFNGTIITERGWEKTHERMTEFIEWKNRKFLK